MTPKYTLETYKGGDPADAWTKTWEQVQNQPKEPFLQAQRSIFPTLTLLERSIATAGLRGLEYAGYAGFHLLNARTAQQLGDWLLSYLREEAPHHSTSAFEVRVMDRLLGFRVWLPTKAERQALATTPAHAPTQHPTPADPPEPNGASPQAQTPQTPDASHAEPSEQTSSQPSAASPSTHGTP